MERIFPTTEGGVKKLPSRTMMTLILRYLCDIQSNNWTANGKLIEEDISFLSNLEVNANALYYVAENLPKKRTILDKNVHNYFTMYIIQDKYGNQKTIFVRRKQKEDNMEKFSQKKDTE